MARERGENGIKELEPGKWQVRITYTDSGGKRRVFKRLAETITDAKKLRKDFLKDLDTTGEKALDGDRMTFEKLASVYRKRKLFPAQYVGGRKVAGVRSLEPALSNLRALNDHFSRRHIKLITSSDVENFKSERLSAPTKNDLLRAQKAKQPVVCTRTVAAVNRELELLRAMLNFAKREGWLFRSPFELGASLISKIDENQRERILSHEEEKRLLEELGKPRRKHLLPFVITALDTGIRRGELFKLCWSDVDFNNKIITIQAMTTKTMTKRVVGMTPRVESELRKLYERSVDKTNGLVFGLTNSIKTGLKSALKDAGIEGFHFHDSRHTAITRMVNEGLPSGEVMKTSGHTQMKTFQRYVNPTEDTVRRNAERLGQYNKVRMSEIAGKNKNEKPID